ncbi:MAG: DUF935 family protein [Chthonomonas sp.]|nr:DUF935 family protein [Chthonomonas sp.]
MFNIFNRSKTKVQKQLAQQMTQFERRALELPGTPPTTLPYATYAAMEKDSMVQTALTIKRLAVLAPNWRVVAANESDAAKRNVDFVLQAFERMAGSPPTILSQAMGAFSRGWSVQEVVYRPDGKHITIESLREKDPSYFGIQSDEFGGISGLTLRIPGEMDRILPRGKFILYFNRSSFDRPKGQSDLDAAYPHYLAKQTLLKAWKLHLERFASPTVMAKYQRGLPAEEQSGILRALKELQNNTAIVFPNEIDISTLGGHREQVSGFLDALEFHNREVARSILGQTLTTDEGRRVGSLALGKVHLQVLLLQVQAIRRELADVVMTEQVIRPLIELNFGPGNIPRFEFEPTTLEAFTTGKLG